MNSRNSGRSRLSSTLRWVCVAVFLVFSWLSIAVGAAAQPTETPLPPVTAPVPTSPLPSPPSPEQSPASSEPTAPVVTPDLNVHVDGVKTGSPAWLTGVIGALSALAGSYLTHWSNERRSRRERSGDHVKDQLDALAVAVEELDAALEKASGDNPSLEANADLKAKSRKFRGKVELVDDSTIRTLATDWERTAKRYFVALGEEEEMLQAPSLHAVGDAQTKLFVKIREARAKC